MFTWFDGHMLALLFIIPLAVIIGVGLVNGHLARRTRRANLQRRLGTVRVHLKADATQFITELERAAEETRRLDKRDR